MRRILFSLSLYIFIIARVLKFVTRKYLKKKWRGFGCARSKYSKKKERTRQKTKKEKPSWQLHYWGGGTKAKSEKKKNATWGHLRPRIASDDQNLVHRSLSLFSFSWRQISSFSNKKRQHNLRRNPRIYTRVEEGKTIKVFSRV
jgi:hypothetical protein